MAELDGKVAIVTGAASGIGEASARALAAAGAKVAIGALHESKAKPVADSIVAAGGEAIAVAFDTSDEAQVAEGIATVVRTFGGVDILHNNAAITSPDFMMQDGMIHELDVGLWDQTMGVNVRGYMLCAKHVIPHMLARGGGVIINTSSGAGMQGEGVRAAYGTSKAAIIGFTRNVATQYGKMGIRCNTVVPGMTLTSTISTNVPAQMLEMMKRHHLTPDMPGPEDTANAVVFLASDRAAFITGVALPVDGGFSAHGPSYADDMMMYAMFTGAAAAGQVDKFRRVLKARGRSKLKADDQALLNEVFAENSVWYGVTDDGVPHVRGPAELAAAWTNGSKQTTKRKVGDVYSDGTHIVAVTEVTGGTGKKAQTIRQANIVHLNQQGKATEVWSLPSDAAVDSALASGKPMAEHPNVAKFRDAEEARARNTFAPDDMALIDQFLVDDVHWISAWGQGPTNRDEVVQQFKTFKEATGGTMALTLNEVFADDTHALSLVRLQASRPDHPDKRMDVKEANVFHLDDKGRAFEFWGVADDQPQINNFWM